jgi:DNA-binding response OmpR family regulator
MRTEHRILIVDDDDAIRALLMTVLRRRGYNADDAHNGAVGIEKLQGSHYSLVLLDLMMPRVSGYEVLEFLSSEPANRRPLVLVLTAGLERKPIDSSLVLGTIHKPFDVDLLVDTITGCLSTVAPPQSTPLAVVPAIDKAN